MQHLQQQLSTARESHVTQQRMLQGANGESGKEVREKARVLMFGLGEADRLRVVLLGKEEDVAGLKGTIEGYEDEKRSVRLDLSSSDVR